MTEHPEFETGQSIVCPSSQTSSQDGITDYLNIFKFIYLGIISMLYIIFYII